MGEKIVVGPINKGLRTDRVPFVIDNDSFPLLVNAYQWRGRIKRKRGTAELTRLRRYFDSTIYSYTGADPQPYQITLDGTGSGNLFTGPYDNITPLSVTLQVNGNISLDPSTIVTITDTTAAIVYTDPAKDGNLVPSGTINYATGAFSLGVGAAGHTVTAVFTYFPDLPVMGIRDVLLRAIFLPGTIAFDTTYAYNVPTLYPNQAYDVSFYKNPPAPDPALPSYTPKAIVEVTPTSWNGQNYQQFWTANYQGAFWATNGLTSPFSAVNVGMQFKPITVVDNIVGGPPALADLSIAAHGLLVGDFVFINEVVTTTGINFQTGYVTVVVNPNKVTVEFPNATIAGNGTGGIAQYLTNRSDPTKDCLRWYDGDPTNGTNPPTLNGRKGWVNFCPPLSQLDYTISDSMADQYYLVGASMIVPFKDRLLFFGPVIQTSDANSQIYLQDTVIYSQNGTPFYTASFTGPVFSATTVYNPILVPTNQTATANAYFEDITGYGGFIEAGYQQPITTVSPNEDTLMTGFTNRQTRVAYTGNDIVPFNFFLVNSELGTSSTFSTINLDRGVLSIGDHGILMANQVGAQRIDLEIPDQVFQFNLASNGFQRVTAARDFINEWIYFTYPAANVPYVFPNQTLLYNYREQTWGIFNESYTAYGQFRPASGNTWGTIGEVYETWGAWTVPWSAGASTLLQPQVVGGTTQGFLIRRDESIEETFSIEINNISFPFPPEATVFSPNHMLNAGDFIVIDGVLGTIANGGQINGQIFEVQKPTATDFRLGTIDRPDLIPGTYIGGGLIKRMYVPQIQTKQFPVQWGMARRTRLGPQQYLFTDSTSGQITLQIFLSQNSADAYNDGLIVPELSANNALIYSDILFTSPNIEIVAVVNTPLGPVGNGMLTTININFPINLVPGTLNIFIGSVATFMDLSTGSFAVTGTGVAVGSSINYMTGAAVLVFSAAPFKEPSLASYSYFAEDVQTPTAIDQDQIWQRMNTSLVGDTVQIGFTMSFDQMTDPNFKNQFAEIELHGMVLDVSPASLLA